MAQRYAACPVTSHGYQAMVAALRAAGCVFAEDEASLLLGESLSPADLQGALSRRIAGEPLEQVLGWVSFRGLRIHLDPGVFVPRRRTEFLAATAIGLVAGVPRPVVLDLCCGSGAVGAAVLAHIPDAQLHAVDIDPNAVACAIRNVGPRAWTGDLFDPLPSTLRETVHVVVANVPYVPSAALSRLPSEARDYEPRVALDGGADGLDVARRVVAQVAHWLRPGGSLLIETSDEQATAMAGLFESGGLRARIEQCDEVGATIVVGS
jgi:release factor glutamine methyltransferase